MKRGPKSLRDTCPELFWTMRTYLRNGMSVTRACQRVGISRSTWYRHLRANRGRT